MKILLFIAIIQVSTLLISIQAQDSSLKVREDQASVVATYYNIAEKAYISGELEKSKSALRKVFKIDPSHGPSYALALKIKKNKGSFKIKVRQKELAAIIIPQVDFDKMPIEDALDYFTQKIKKASNDKIIPNFIIIDKSESLKNEKVTLNLQNIPADAVLKYLLELSNSTAKFGQHTITIRPR